MSADFDDFRGPCGHIPPTDDCPKWTSEVVDDLCAACYYVDYLYDLEQLADEEVLDEDLDEFDDL